jgi:uncharacterized membrane protein
MKQLLQRRPLSVPLHSTLANWALALLLASLLLDLVAWAGGARDTTGANVGAYVVLFTALVVTVLAILAALADTLDLTDEMRRLGWSYTGILFAVLILQAAGLILRNLTLQDQLAPPVPVFLSLAAFLGAVLSAWLGGSIATREIEEELEEELEEPEPLRRRRRR